MSTDEKQETLDQLLNSAENDLPILKVSYRDTEASAKKAEVVSDTQPRAAPSTRD